MTAVDRAAEVLESLDWKHTGPDYGRAPIYAEQAQALADAGLLVTDEIQAVLDAVMACEPPRAKSWEQCIAGLLAAGDAYLASRPS